MQPDLVSECDTLGVARLEICLPDLLQHGEPGQGVEEAGQAGEEVPGQLEPLQPGQLLHPRHVVQVAVGQV